MQFVELSKEEYSLFMENEAMGNFWQSPYMGDFQEAEGKKSNYVGVKENGKLIAASLLVQSPLKLGFCRVDATRGLCLDYTNTQLLDFFVEEVKQYINKKKAVEFVMSPYFSLRTRDIDGELVEGGEDHTDIVEHLKQLGFSHQGYTTGFEHELEPRWIYCLDLEGKTEEQLFKETTRNNIRRHVNASEKRGLHVRKMEEKDVSTFYTMMKETGERQGFGYRDQDFYQLFFDKMGPIFDGRIVEMHIDEYRANTQERLEHWNKEKTVVLKRIEDAPENEKHKKRLSVVEEGIEVEQKNLTEIQELEENYGKVIPLCAGYFLTYAKECVYLFGVSYDEFMKYGATSAMQWHMICNALKDGCSRYNFYGISGLFEKDDDGYGVYYFKRGFGGYVDELPGEFHLKINPRYKIYQGIKKLTGRK